MPIKTISDVRRCPRLGHIRLGIKKTSEKSGKEYPAEVNYFILDPETGDQKRNKVSTVRFTSNKDGTVTDSKTGLIWVKNPHTDLPEKFKDSMTWRQAIDACKELNFAGRKDWRLPTIEELRELVDYARGAKVNEPTVDTKYFPDTKCSWYWTSTSCAWGSGSAWCVNFYGGIVYNDGKDNGIYVRPVRSSQ